jgi:hypothetical protein
MSMAIAEALAKINAKLKAIDRVPAGIGSKGEWGFDVEAVRALVAGYRPELRCGTWIIRTEIPFGSPDKECSECGALSLIHSHYCHNCGANMHWQAPGEVR